MLRLSAYLLRETISLYWVGLFGFILLLLIDFLTTWAAYLINYQAPIDIVGRLMGLKVPFFLHLSLPIAVVFAVLLATGRLAKDSELKAIYSSGVSPLRLLTPLLVFGALVSLIAIINNGFLEPRGEVAYDRTVASFFYERPPAEIQNDVAYVVDGQGIFFAGRMRGVENDLAKAQLQGVLVILENGSQLSAPTGLWDSDQGVWLLEDASLLSPGGAPERLGQHILAFDTRQSSDLTQPRQLALDQLWKRIESVRSTRGDARPLLFEFHRRLADASGAFIFALLAGSLGLHLRGRSAGFAWTIALLVLFYFIWMLSGDLYDRNVLSPIAAAWFTPLVVGSIGAALAITRLR